MARRHSNSPTIPKHWRTFPRRPWPISKHRYEGLRVPSVLHFDCYLLRHETNRDSYALIMLASRHGHRVAGVRNVLLDASTGRAMRASKRLDGYVPTLASDDAQTLSVGNGALDLMLRGGWFDLLPGYTRRSVVLHWCNEIRRAPTLSESATRYALPDIL